MKQKLLILLTLLTFCTATSSAQRNYPIRATVQYTPPYSLFLGDYATPKLIITLTGQDLLDANCPYKLSFSLECQNVKVTTKPSFNPAPLYINGGQTIVLTGADLARYFDIQNLDFHGITAAKYLQDGQLPEGFYRMNVKVIHYHENRVISNTAFTMFNARMGKPPVLSLPKNKTLIPPAQQQSPIVFTWIPKTVGAFNYKFELWECAVPGIPVQTVVSTVRPIYSQTYTTSQISFHPATVNMKPGMEYAWRITVEDPHNQQKFANQGQSEIFTFTYKRKPEPVTGLRFTNRGLKITWTWDMDPAHTKYYFEYYDPQTGRTIDPVACDYAEFVRNMPQTGYHLKVRVKAECYGDPTLMSDYTPYLDTYLEPIPVPEYECGKVFEDREITNLELKHSFAPGEIVESKNGDTRYEIIFSEEKNGYLSGQFFMIMDCWGGAKIRCEFSKTQINTDNIVLKTIFHSVTDSTLYIKPETIRKEVEQAFFDAATVLTDFSIKDTVKIDKPYTYLYINESGKVVAVSVNNNGKTEEKTTEISATNLKENTLIQGKNGEELVLTKKGQVMGKTEFNATGGNSVLLKEYHRKSDSLAQWQINFSKYDAQTYAFDHIGSGDHGIFSSSEYYPQVGSYDFRYKSVECGKNDKVIVEFDTYREKDSVVFKDKYGVTYPIKDRILTFTGVSQADTNYIYAYRGDKKIGKLFLNTYQKKTYKVVLISVNEAKLPKINQLQKVLNDIFRQAVDSFEISTDTLTIKNLFPFTHGDKNRFSGYNDDQKRVLQAYDSRIQPDINYLFFIPDGAETNGVAGYNPLGYNFGFIYYGAGNRTIAHELAHGIASLQHPFPESQVSGRTDNLMDYNEGLTLWHFQWDKLQNPPNRIFKWRFEEEDAEDLLADTVFYLKIADTNTKYKSDESIEIESYLGKSYEIQLLKGDSVYNCDWKYRNTVVEKSDVFKLDISLPQKDTLYILQHDSLLAKYFISINQYDDYKIKIEELDKYLSRNDSLLLPTEKDSLIHLVFVRGEKPIKCTWQFNSTTAQDTSSYSLPIDKEVKDTLKIYWKDTLLLGSLKIDIQNLPYVFKIKDTTNIQNIQAKSGTEMYVVQRKRNLDLQLFRGDSLITGIWSVDSTNTPTSTVSIDFSKESSNKITVNNVNNKEIASVDLIIYKKSEVVFDTLPSYKGEFGFDNACSVLETASRIRLVSDYNKYKYKILDNTRYASILSIQPNSLVSLKMTVNVADEFMNDSSAVIKFVSSKPDLSMTLNKTNSLSNSNLKTKSSNLTIEIKSKILPDYEWIYAIDNANDTIGILSVICQNINFSKKLHIYYLSDTILKFPTENFFDKGSIMFNENSYNQSFVNFDIKIMHYQFKNDFLNRMNKSNNSFVDLPKTVLDSLHITRTNKGDDYYLFLVPIDSFYVTTPTAIYSFSGFCNSPSATDTSFFHDVYLSKNALDVQIGIHEVGHAFGLTHIFDKPYYIYKPDPSKSDGKGHITNNFMDYSGAKNMTRFWYFQWRKINTKIK
ncbi:MAG: hypothetical protein J6T70_03010 [Bacteroidales bacterium]|nr:hypothetical protein [Bacteroidales bacterium]